jgi:hypothetical protein
MKRERDIILLGFRKEIFLIILLFSIFLSSPAKFYSAFPDSTQKRKERYDINDPRNPDCPCHKYQELADREYWRLQKAATNKGSSNNFNGKFKAKKIRLILFNLERKFQKITYHQKKVKVNYSACFHWK